VAVTVKICGITNVEDALVAVDAGANALGFVFYASSPRAVGVDQAASICREIPPHVARVGVFVNPDEALVQRALVSCGLSILQWHGEETPEFCLQFGIMSMKAFRLKDAAALEAISTYRTNAILLDAYNPGIRGGTGEICDWQLALEAKKFGRPIFLAGGLTPENVGTAIEQVRPYGVDVSSGVEAVPGRKDHDKVRRFITAAKAIVTE
jgi:phosphoribosylanthranilate isomerase